MTSFQSPAHVSPTMTVTAESEVILDQHMATPRDLTPQDHGEYGAALRKASFVITCRGPGGAGLLARGQRTP